jgi:hypothetical protein
VQWEFAGRLAPPPGRYVVRRYAGDDVRAVVVVTPAVAPRREGRRLARREPPGTVEVTRVTVIDASSGAAPTDWLERAEATLAQFLAAHRVAVADPDAPGPGSAVIVRAGTGTGARLAEGDWDDARELPTPEPPRRPRRSKHRPAERLAALMSGRDAVLACEELALRARGDLRDGRNREAALQLEAAMLAAIAELKGWITHGDLGLRLDELRDLLPEVREAAAAAREGRLEAPQVEVVAAALARLEAALRARAVLAAE